MIADISTGRLLCRNETGAWLIQHRQQLTPLDQLPPIALLPLLERSWPELRASLDPADADELAEPLTSTLALALGWETNYWVELGLRWVESDHRFIESLQGELTALTTSRRKGTQNLRHRARRLLPS